MNRHSQRVEEVVKNVWGRCARLFPIPMSSLNLSFLQLNVQAQIRSAKSILAQADRLKEIRRGVHDPVCQREISESISGLLHTAHEIVINAHSTAESARLATEAQRRNQQLGEVDTDA